MMRYSLHLARLACLLLFAGLMMNCWDVSYAKNNSKTVSQEEYERAVKGQNKFHSFLRQGDAYYKTGRYDEALNQYWQAYNFSKGASIHSVAADQLIRIYEESGDLKRIMEIIDEEMRLAQDFKEPYRTKAITEWSFKQKAYALELSNDLQEAIELYEQRLEQNRKNLDKLSEFPREYQEHRGLARLYEKAHLYDKALVHAEWLKNFLDDDPLVLERVKRIQNKISETAWENEQDPIVLQFKESFEKASHAEQAAVLSTFGGKGIWEDFKNAMVAEHAGNFSEARQIYESLLAKKAEIEKEMGVHGWAMLYPAIQRTSEFLKDKEREKEALIWIQRNLLSPNGEYHASLSKLLPEVVAHIKERLREYNL